MKYQLILPKTVEKKLNKLDQKAQNRIKTSLVLLAANPYIGKKLQGKYEKYYSLRVWPYRVIYEIIQRKCVVLVINIAHRQGVY